MKINLAIFTQTGIIGRTQIPRKVQNKVQTKNSPEGESKLLSFNFYLSSINYHLKRIFIIACVVHLASRLDVELWTIIIFYWLPVTG